MNDQEQNLDQDQGFEVNMDDQFILSKHKILVDYSLKSLSTPEGIKRYAKRALARVIHDDAEISKVKLKKPRMTSRMASRLFGKPAYAKLYVFTKF
jgi:hypothetical protein